MFIKYGKQNIHALAAHGSEIRWLQPGWNEFPDEVWNMHKNDPEIVKMLEDGDLELKTEEDVGMKEIHRQKDPMGMPIKKGKKGAEIQRDQPRYLGQDNQEVSLLTMNDEKQIFDIIKNTYNKGILQRWIDEENRSKIKRKLEEQLKSLSADAEKSSK